MNIKPTLLLMAVGVVKKNKGARRRSCCPPSCTPHESSNRSHRNIFFIVFFLKASVPTSQLPLVMRYNTKFYVYIYPLFSQQLYFFVFIAYPDTFGLLDCIQLDVPTWYFESKYTYLILSPPTVYLFFSLVVHIYPLEEGAGAVCVVSL